METPNPPKKARPLLPEEPSVLLVREKHGTWAYPARTPKQLEKSALQILKSRFEAGYYNPSPEPEAPALTAEQVAALPAGRVKDVATREWEDWKYRRSEALSTRSFNNAVRAALKTNDGQRAWRLLLMRHAYEYERIDLVRLEKDYATARWGTPESLDTPAP